MTGNKSRIPRRCKETMAKVEQKQVVVNEIKAGKGSIRSYG